MPELRLEVQKHVRPLPETREEMVEIAALYWNLLPSNSALKQRHFTSKSDSSHKRFRNSNQGFQKRKESDSPTEGKSDRKTTRIHLNQTHPRRQIWCFDCGSLDHIRPNCPKNVKIQETVSRQSKSKNSKGSK